VSVLETQPPRFTADEVARIAEELFAISGAAVDLGSERDATFLIDDGGDGAVLKISNLGEDPAVLDLEQAAIEHILRVDPELPVARPRGERATFDGHHIRLFERLHGRSGEFITALHGHGLITVPAAEEVVRLLPPLTISEEEIDQGCEMLEVACREFVA